MSGRIRLVILTLVFVLTSCRDNDKTNPVEQLALTETVLDRTMVGNAIEAANSILGSRTGIQLVGSWPNVNLIQDSNHALVFLIDRTFAPSEYYIMVPKRDCRCIFLQPTVFEDWMHEHTASLRDQMLPVEPQTVLTFMLLHEVGHIVHGDPGQFQGSEQQAFNLNSTAEKEMEKKAEQFAVQQIDAALNEHTRKGSDGWLAATRVEMMLGDLSWNLSAMRTVNHPGATTLCSHFLFFDSGYTHPNFELRILTDNYMLARSQSSKQLLNNFVGCRTNSLPQTIYQLR